MLTNRIAITFIGYGVEAKALEFMTKVLDREKREIYPEKKFLEIYSNRIQFLKDSIKFKIYPSALVDASLRIMFMGSVLLLASIFSHGHPYVNCFCAVLIYTAVNMLLVWLGCYKRCWYITDKRFKENYTYHFNYANLPAEAVLLKAKEEIPEIFGYISETKEVKTT
jgi:hypothetical protein